MAQKFLPLTPAVFHILLALWSEEKHGYGIAKQVKLDSQNSVKMGPGTLYGSIERMLKDNLVEESDERPDPELDDGRRKYYRLTAKGKKFLDAELTRYKNITKIAKRNKFTFNRAHSIWLTL